VAVRGELDRERQRLVPVVEVGVGVVELLLGAGVSRLIAHSRSMLECRRKTNGCSKDLWAARMLAAG
jgi:hypothetical protein